LHVQRAARALARRFDDALRPFELSNGQFSLLMSLNRPEPPPMGPVASLLAMDRTTLTAALKPLERRGLVELSQDPSDRRSRILILTAKGRKLLSQAFPVWKGTHDEVELLIADENPRMLRKSLRALSSVNDARSVSRKDEPRPVNGAHEGARSTSKRTPAAARS
jgi:DNA-binding MarR family transcriptional regulator